MGIDPGFIHVRRLRSFPHGVHRRREETEPSYDRLSAVQEPFVLRCRVRHDRLWSDGPGNGILPAALSSKCVWIQPAGGGSCDAALSLAHGPGAPSDPGTVEDLVGPQAAYHRPDSHRSWEYPLLGSCKSR